MSNPEPLREILKRVMKLVEQNAYRCFNCEFREPGDCNYQGEGCKYLKE